MANYTRKWTDEMLFEAAAKFQTRRDFEKGNNLAYQAATRRKLLNQVCSHMKPQLTTWTYEMLRDVASKFDTRIGFEKGNNRAYHAALRLGILDQICSHMEPLHTVWTDDMLFEAASEFETRVKFQQGNSKAYDSAWRRNILDQICAHMEPQHTVWTDDMLFATAVEYETRAEFQKCNSNAYQAAQHRGILDCVCAHMERGIYGFDPSKPAVLYVVQLDNHTKSYIGFGISNYLDGRMSDHVRNANRDGFALIISRVIDFEMGKDAYNLERKLKQTLPIVNTGIEGFKREAILASDHNKLEDIINNHVN